MIKNQLKSLARFPVYGARRVAGLERGSENIRFDAEELWKYLFKYTRAQRLLRRGQLKDYSSLKISTEAENVTSRVRDEARAIYGSRFEYLSAATNREVVHAFETVVDALAGRFEKINYLEIGSAQGLSMSLMALLLKQKGRLGRLISIDPYFEEGYLEGERSPWGRSGVSQSTGNMRDRALQLYESLGLEVEQRRAISLEGLSELVAAREKFELIYVDGYHEGLTPALDIGMSLALLQKNAAIMLDDHQWPDVRPLRELFSLHAESIVMNWKIVAFSVDLHSEMHAAQV